jgi:hypothetical protein
MSSAAADADLQAQLMSDLGDLVRKLPHEIRAETEDATLKAAIAGDASRIIAHAGAYLTARLSAEKV